MDEHAFCSNNICQSANNIIKNFIQINSEIKIDKFEKVIKTLFIRLKYNKNNHS